MWVDIAEVICEDISKQTICQDIYTQTQMHDSTYVCDYIYDM